MVRAIVGLGTARRPHLPNAAKTLSLVTVPSSPRAVLVLVALLSAACAQSPVAPQGPISMFTPTPHAPANGATVAHAAQPVTLSVSNATTTGASDAVVYTFEVATDPGFTSKVAAKDAVQTPTRTSLTLDVLPPAKYYWRARATAGSSISGFTTTTSFTIVPGTSATGTIQAPLPFQPAIGTSVIGLKPTLTVNNAARSGVGAVAYWFEVATDAGFSMIVASGGASEGTSKTSFAPASNLSHSTTYFWRARAFEIGSGLSGPFSPPWTFVTGKT